MRHLTLLISLTVGLFSFSQDDDCKKLTTKSLGATSNNDCCKEDAAQADYILNLADQYKKELTKLHCPFGLPKSKRESVMTLYSHGYICGYDTVYHVPIWVAYRMWDEELWNEKLTREDCFRIDPRLPKNHQIKHSDYTRSGFDRGHLKPANDAKKDEFEHLNSFVMTNMAPQYGHMNQKEWMAIEGYCNAISRKDTVKRAYMITGSIVDENPEWIYDKVAIPSYFYKIFFFQGKEAGWQYWIFYVKNDKVKVDIRDFEKELRGNAKSVDELEALTNTNFYVSRRKQKATERIVRKDHIKDGMFIHNYQGYKYVTDL